MSNGQLPSNPYISGWWTAPNVRVGSPGGYNWAQRHYSPELMGGIGSMYDLLQRNLTQAPDTAGEWRRFQPGSLAAGYESYLGGSPELEQMEYNRALGRLKGQVGTATQNLQRTAGARRGGAGYGGYGTGMNEIGRGLLQGTQEIATTQAMKNLADREQRQQQLLGYQQQDIANQQGWLGGLTGAMGQDWQNRQGALNMYGGWLGQQIPFEQWNIQTPRSWAAQQAGLNLRARGMEESINAQRRAESMGWINNLMGWQNQLANQYYGGQGQWMNYAGNRGQNILGGYDPSWYSWTQM